MSVWDSNSLIDWQLLKAILDFLASRSPNDGTKRSCPSQSCGLWGTAVQSKKACKSQAEELLPHKAYLSVLQPNYSSVPPEQSAYHDVSN